MIDVLVARVFSTRNLVHLHHWKTRSYAQHVTLGEFYDTVIDDVDTLVEAYQGMYGKINVPFLPKIDLPNSIVKHLENEVVWIIEKRCEIAQDCPTLENLLDNLSAAYLKVIYKLKNLS